MNVTTAYSPNNESWNHQAWLIEGDTDILLKNTVGGLLWIALFDFVHHRGQLSSYIRPMGGKVPSIYGPSADEAAQTQEEARGALDGHLTSGSVGVSRKK
jgi:uncharacterized damage-inducible protein DinB